MNGALKGHAPDLCALPVSLSRERMPQRTLASRLAGRALREIRTMLGLSSFLRNEDRRVLEQIIFPYFLNDRKCRDVLFVGCDWYTAGYSAWFEDKNYWTIEIDPTLRKFGAKQHIVDSLQNLSRHFPRGALDLIVCNGVYGWGLNERAEIEAAFTACYECLREDGVLVIGWDDVAHLNPCPLSTWQCLQDFRPFVFPPLHTAEFVTATAHRHVYSFFRRPHAAERADHHERDRA
jgi:hypothetical protein